MGRHKDESLIGKKTKEALEEVKDNYDPMLPSVVWSPVEEPVNFHEEPTKAKLWARWAWFSGKFSITEIAEAIGVAESTPRFWIRGNQKHKGWSQEKAELDRKYITKIVKDRNKEMSVLLDKMLHVIGKNLDDIIENRAELTISEMNQISSMYEKIFKTKQLSEGRPTDIQGNLTTWDEVRDRMIEVDILDFSKAKKNG